MSYAKKTAIKSNREYVLNWNWKKRNAAHSCSSVTYHSYLLSRVTDGNVIVNGNIIIVT